MSTGENRGRRFANRKRYRFTLNTTSENDPIKDRSYSRTSLDCLPPTLRNSPFSNIDDRSTNVRRNCENILTTRQNNKGISAPLSPSSRAGGTAPFSFVIPLFAQPHFHTSACSFGYCVTHLLAPTPLRIVLRHAITPAPL